jgi:hypothetical protein
MLAAAALDVPLSVSRLNDVFASGILTWPGGDVVEWLNRHFAPESTDGAIEVLGSIRESRHLLAATEALGQIADEAAAAILGRLPDANEPAYVDAILTRLADEGHVPLLRATRDAEPDPALRRVMQRVLARHGDVDAQLELTAAPLADAKAGRPLDDSLLDWHAAARNERLIAPLGQLLAHLSDPPDPTSTLQRYVRMALAATRSEDALAVFDQLADDPDRPLRAFQWYPRAELAGDLATERVLARLPNSPACALDVLRRLGFHR